jgi:hypothetical protein
MSKKFSRRPVPSIPPKLKGEGTMKISCQLAAIALIAAATAHAQGLRFSATLTGAQQEPSVNTQGTGTIEAIFDEGFTTVRVVLQAANVVGVRSAHFHCQAPGVVGPIVFGIFDPGPLFFDGTRTEGSLTNANFLGADCLFEIGRPVNNIAALAFAMREGLIYADVHTSANANGEVRGQMLGAGDTASETGSGTGETGTDTGGSTGNGSGSIDTGAGKGDTKAP